MILCHLLDFCHEQHISVDFLSFKPVLYPSLSANTYDKRWIIDQKRNYSYFSRQRPQLLPWYYFREFFSGLRVFPHTVNPPRRPSRAHHLGKHFLCIRFLFAPTRERGLFVLCVRRLSRRPRFLRQAACQVISNISHYIVWFGELYFTVKTHLQVEMTPWYPQR